MALMNPKAVARKYLEWFTGDALDQKGEVFYATGTDYAVRYRNTHTGVMHNAMDRVRELAAERLEPQDAVKVIAAAEALLAPQS